MRAPIWSLLLLPLVPLATASTLLIKNYCPTPLHLYISNSSVIGQGSLDLPTGQALLKSISGQGNTVSITKQTDFFSPDTGKLNVGASVGSDGNLYWTLSLQDRPDPFGSVGQKVNVTSNGCGTATGPGTQVYVCRDAAEVQLVVNLCA